MSDRQMILLALAATAAAFFAGALAVLVRDDYARAIRRAQRARLRRLR